MTFTLLKASISPVLLFHFDIDNFQVSLFWLDNVHHMFFSLSPLSLNDCKTGIWASQNIDSTYLDFIISLKTSRHSDRCEIESTSPATALHDARARGSKENQHVSKNRRRALNLPSSHNLSFENGPSNIFFNKLYFRKPLKDIR